MICQEGIRSQVFLISSPLYLVSNAWTKKLWIRSIKLSKACLRAVGFPLKGAPTVTTKEYLSSYQWFLPCLRIKQGQASNSPRASVRAWMVFSLIWVTSVLSAEQSGQPSAAFLEQFPSHLLRPRHCRMPQRFGSSASLGVLCAIWSRLNGTKRPQP